ncbi:hypothetical protein ACI394_29485, partial [Klebsiella pneumoniae]|uniref:hypothetical protein n=1 Tax=Klebsiella pneumoniae TaxID=573 RepID=UPI00385482A2
KQMQLLRIMLVETHPNDEAHEPLRRIWGAIYIATVVLRGRKKAKETDGSVPRFYYRIKGEHSFDKEISCWHDKNKKDWYDPWQ